MNSIPRQVFLSYSTDDNATATTVRDHLEAEGIACWMAPRDITPGKDYGEQIISAIEEATIFLLILSESSNHSTFVRHEVERAVSKSKVIIPFRIQPVQPSRSLEFFISNYQWVDGWEGVAAECWDALQVAVQTHLQGHTTRAVAVAPSSPPVTPAPPSNLPHQLTPFIGRQRELAAIDELMGHHDVRLVTILGPGGMGKTRLSLAVAERELAKHHHQDGVYYVPLAPLGQVEHIVLTLADALSISLQIGETRAAMQQILEYLRTRSMLLLFDNFEHLLEGAELLAQILRAAPQVQILVTSRERLRLPGEHLFPIQGLDYGQPVHFADAAESAAVQLFLQSARQLDPDLTPRTDEFAHVAAICRLVDGMPLGIELAASWIEVLSPEEIALEIQRSLDFLETEQRGIQEQHRSVRAVFDSTWQRLDSTEQQVFARLSLFRGGFTRESAEQVADASLRLLSTLSGKSLIQHEREQGRYAIHELLRQFGEERLLADLHGAHETSQRLCTYFTTFLQRQETHLKGRLQLEAIAAIEAEIENVRTAWQWAVTHRQTEAIDHSLGALWVFYGTKSWYQEGSMAFGLAADAVDVDNPSVRDRLVRARILARQGAMLASLDYAVVGAMAREQARDLCQHSLQIFEILGAHTERVIPLSCLASLAFTSGDIDHALQLYEEALSLATDQHDTWSIAHALHNLGACYASRGQYEQAIAYQRQALVMCDGTGDLRSMGSILFELADTLRAAGEYQEAKQVADMALELSTETHAKRNLALTLRMLGELAWNMGDFTAAQQHAAASLALMEELGLTRLQDAPLVVLGNAACGLEDYAQARAHFQTVLRPHQQAGTLCRSWFAAEAVVGLANVLVKEGRTAQVVELLSLVLYHPAAWQETKDQAMKLLTQVRPEMPSQREPPARPLDVVITELLNA